MKAAVLHAVGDLRYEDVPVPRITDRDVLAKVKAAGVIQVRWQYRTGGTAASDFGIYYQANPYITLGSPNTTETYTTDKTYTKNLSLVDGTCYWLAITARTSGGVESTPVKVGPYIADSTAPSTPSLTASAVWAP